jgi:hypothetical protein
MEMQSKMLDALLEKAEQVIRLLEVSDDTKCEPSHKSVPFYNKIIDFMLLNFSVFITSASTKRVGSGVGVASSFFVAMFLSNSLIV